MEYRKLGDLFISRLAYGCWAMGGHGWGVVNDQDSLRAVGMALDLGVNFFDTADVYGLGHSEVILGKALGSRRHDVVIATKFGVSMDAQGNIGRNGSAQYVVKALEASLRRLRLECIPLYQIHWPDKNTPIVETMNTLKRCQEQGKIRYIGCSNFGVTEIEEARLSGSIVSLQTPYSLLDRGKGDKLIEHCIKNSMHMFTYGSLAKGLFSGKFTQDITFSSDDVRSKDPHFKGERLLKNLQIVTQVKRVARKYNKSTAQVALRWILDTPGVSAAIVGIKTPTQIKENIGALHWTLSAEDYHFLCQIGGDIGLIA